MPTDADILYLMADWVLNVGLVTDEVNLKWIQT